MLRTLATVIVIGLLAAGGFAIYRLGWSQGYTAAELAAQGQEGPASPLAPRGWRPVGWASEGLLISLVLPLILFAFVGKLTRVILWIAVVRLPGWRTAHGRFGSYPLHWTHGPEPSWYGPWQEQPSDKSQQTDDRVGMNASA